ncbi:MAG: hypothetical protein PHS44_04290 [Candidatus Dojkabacteria bacterium]|jgi:F420-0:gamma-glutamyl ligase|nr:hypothetical protein [Candidatus Dojkabacteria bacterium]
MAAEVTDIEVSRTFTSSDTVQLVDAVSRVIGVPMSLESSRSGQATTVLRKIIVDKQDNVVAAHLIISRWTSEVVVVERIRVGGEWTVGRVLHISAGIEYSNERTASILKNPDDQEMAAPRSPRALREIDDLRVPRSLERQFDIYRLKTTKERLRDALIGLSRKILKRIL